MCYGCYEEYGKPVEINDATKRAAELIAKVYEGSCVGGNLHIVVDDWNIEDDNLEFCRKAIEENYHGLPKEQQQVERDCLMALQAMDMDGRASALAIYDKFITVS